MVNYHLVELTFFWLKNERWAS